MDDKKVKPTSCNPVEMHPNCISQQSRIGRRIVRYLSNFYLLQLSTPTFIRGML